MLNHGGKISFSFYLLHLGMLHVLATYLGPFAATSVPLLDAAFALAGACGATWALAALSYWSIEEPFLRMRRGYGSSHPAPTTTAA